MNYEQSTSAQPSEDHNTITLTLNGSACSHEMGAPQETGRILSGNDSGTAININSTSNNAIAVAKAITKVSL